jgi:hypothetical protein
MEGSRLGLDEGDSLGIVDGTADGPALGTVEGAVDGARDGIELGSAEGAKDGCEDGCEEGTELGDREGSAEGIRDGAVLGTAEGARDGVDEGIKLGEADGTRLTVTLINVEAISIFVLLFPCVPATVLLTGLRSPPLAASVDITWTRIPSGTVPIKPAVGTNSKAPGLVALPFKN